MSSTDLYKRLKGTLANESTDQDADVQDAFFDSVLQIVKPAADGAASTASTVGSLKVPFNIQIVEVVVCPSASLTADNTNNAVITLGKADGAGGSSTDIAVLTTNVARGNWANDVFKSFTITAANQFVNDGQILTLKITKGGTGVAVPISSYTVRYRRV